MCYIHTCIHHLKKPFYILKSIGYLGILNSYERVFHLVQCKHHHPKHMDTVGMELALEIMMRMMKLLVHQQ